ncbi:hypothetical protein PHAVU_001G064200 [Phaseolus vulgaris]
MVPPGPPTPLGAQSVPSLLRSNSGMMGGQGGPVPSQTSFPSLVAQRNQFNNMNMIGNMSNVTSLLNQSFPNGIPNSGLAGHGSSQRSGGVDAGAESDPLSGVGNGINFGNTLQSNLGNPGPSGQGQGQQFSNASGNQMLSDQQHSQQLELQSFQHSQQSMQQFSAPLSAQQQQQHFQSIRGGMGGVGSVKLEQQVNNDQFGQQQQQQLPSRNLAQQQQQQQQQQQLLHMSRQSSQAAAAQMNHLLQQQRLLQHQQHQQHQQQQQQQQQLLKAMPQQRPHLPQQFQQQNMRSPVKPSYEPGMCARRLTHYMYQQQHRPEDNNIEFWRKFVAEYFAPNAKKKWCVSMYGSSRQTGVFPQDVWHCEICNRKPGRGFEATAEVLPRLFKIKYESGTLEELLYVDMPREYHNSSGQIVLDYAKAIQESVFEQLRVVRDGQLRIVFSPDLKICSWEFCARRHEELIPRRLLIPQISQLGAVAQKYQAITQNATPNLSVPELQSNCNMFVASARQLAKALEVPLVNDLGYTKRYVRCLQISEVVNSMKDLIDYSRETRTGPMDSLAKFPRRTTGSSGLHSQAQQSEDQIQQQSQPQQPPPHMPHTSNASASTATSTIVGLLHQNSVNSRQNSMNNASSPYGGSSVQIPSPGSSGNVPQAQPNASPFQSPTPSSSNNPQTSHPALTSANHMGTANSPANISLQQQQTSLPAEADTADAQSSVQKIIHEMMMSSQMNGPSGMAGAGSLGNDMKNVNGILPGSNNSGLNNNSGLVGNGAVNSNSGVGVGGYGTMGLGPSGMSNGMRPVMGHNSIMNGRGGLASLARDQVMNQQDLSTQLLSGLGAVNGFNNLQFDWKPSP